MNERELAERLVERLDQGLDVLSPGVAYRLRLAREKALASMHEGGQATGSAPRWGRRLIAPAFVFAVALAGVLMWQQESEPPLKPELAELDAQVLSEELPVTAYLDQGFEVWLYHTSTD